MKKYSIKKSSENLRLEQIKKLSLLLDSKFTIPGTKIKYGIDSIIGVVPGIGDLVSTVLSFYILYSAALIGVRKITLLKMSYNIALDNSIGIIPIFGDILDIALKSNIRNLNLINKDCDRGYLIPRTNTSLTKLMIFIIIGFLISFLILLSVLIFLLLKLKVLWAN